MPRKRRPAAETRAEMLTAARALLLEHGPDGVRLDDVAATVGVSRQAVLHHFGSRAGLMRAVVEGAWRRLFEDLATVTASGDMAPERFLELLDDVARKGGNARVGAWLLLSGKNLPDAHFDGVMAGLPDAVAQRSGTRREEAANALLLASAAVFGDAIFGARLRLVLGIEDSEPSRARFRDWLSDRLWRV